MMNANLSNPETVFKRIWNGLLTEESVKSPKMGASGNLNAARLAALQERKQILEETLAKRNKELRELCMKEAELTGVIPLEIPLEPGESPPAFRRRVGTSFQLPQNLINSLNTEDNSIAAIEVNMQVQANMAEAALSLANEPNINKAVRRQHMQQYQLHKQQYHMLEEKLAILKNNNQVDQKQPTTQLQGQQKQKKKPRDIEQDDTASMNINLRQDPFGKPVFRHSMRSLQYPVSSELSSEQKLVSGHQKLAYRSSDCDSNTSAFRPEDALLPAVYKLSINGYKNYIERKENGNLNQYVVPPYIHSQSNPNLHQQHPQKHYKHLQYIPTSNSTLPHNIQKHPLSVQNSINVYQNFPSQHYIQNNQPYDHKKYSTIATHPANLFPAGLDRQSTSPNYSNSILQKPQYFGTYALRGQYLSSEQGQRTVNPHQIQPHQQYENTVVNSGLGGYWKQSESGEMVWCNTILNDNWKQEKRFGSLDRRRNKRSHNKRTSPSVDPKSATISGTSCHENIRGKTGKTQQIVGRNSQDKQLVRTLSLGSVGAQNTENVWPSNDNLSSGGEIQSITEPVSEGRRSKQKEWFETSLDGPAHPPPSRPQSSMSSAVQLSMAKSISPEEKYTEMLMQPLPFPELPKPVLEIPAESKPNPSPIAQEPKIEFFNNNIPKNCTLIQPGGCKPYHEETKPFEMSDFYKYSVKFKKSPVKQPLKQSDDQQNTANNQQANTEKVGVILKGVYQPLQPMKCQPLNPSESNYDRSMTNAETLGTNSLDISQFSANADSNFSQPMNMWYKNQEQFESSRADSSAGRSTATLV